MLRVGRHPGGNDPLFLDALLISPSVMTLRNKAVDGTDPSEAITLAFGLTFASSETTFVSRRKLKARCTGDGVARVWSRGSL